VIFLHWLSWCLLGISTVKYFPTELLGLAHSQGEEGSISIYYLEFFLKFVPLSYLFDPLFILVCDHGYLFYTLG